MINSIGLQNIGVEAFIRDKVPKLRSVGTPYLVNVFGYAVEDYVEVVRMVGRPLRALGVRTERLVPKHKARGMFFSTDPMPAQ